MSAFELPAPQAEKLRAEAERLGLSPADLARAALTDLLATPDAEFQAVAAPSLIQPSNAVPLSREPRGIGASTWHGASRGSPAAAAC